MWVLLTLSDTWFWMPQRSGFPVGLGLAQQRLWAMHGDKALSGGQLADRRLQPLGSFQGPTLTLRSSEQ